MTDAIAPAPNATRDLINRDVSDLAFVGRVLEEAENDSLPVLERARYLAITGMLLDEFYRIRIAALRERIRSGNKALSIDGTKPARQLRQADKISNRLIRRQDKCWRSIRSALKAAGIRLVSAQRVRAADRATLDRLFSDAIRPALHIGPAGGDLLRESVRDGELLLFVELAGSGRGDPPAEIAIPIPSQLPRFFALPGKAHRFILLEEIIRLHLPELFADHHVLASGLARVLREGSLNRIDHGDDFLSQVRDAIERREHADVIRLRVERQMPARMMNSLARNLGLLEPHEIKALEKSRRRATRSEFIVADSFLGLPDLMQIAELIPPEVSESLSFTALRPRLPDFVTQFRGDLFRAISAGDRLLHFPYDDFGVIVELLRQAAADAAVTHISQTLYRTGPGSPIVAALKAAARAGKSVSVVVEVEARDDEQRNIEFAEELEAAGAQVAYGIDDAKVHAKLLIIERLENGRPQRYLHCSTGNYSASSGRSYTDLCLLTANPRLTDDAQSVFDFVRGGGSPAVLDKIALAPLFLRDKLDALIQREIDNARSGRPAAIWIKVNKLSDRNVIHSLYAASQAGVDVAVIVRGICCLRAGVPGLSERIRVRSVVGRFLEHSRAFCFGNGHALPSESADVYIASADLMPEKLDRRVEILIPVEDAKLAQSVQRDVFMPYFSDQTNAWILGPDDKWVRQSRSGYSVQQALFGDSSPTT